MATVTRRSDGTYAIDYGKPGPFLVLTTYQIRQLVAALLETGQTDTVIANIIRSAR